MTKQKIREWQDRLGGMELPSICLALRASLSGAADPWPDDRTADVIRFLEAVVTAWMPTLIEDEREIDEAVLALVKATSRYAAKLLGCERCGAGRE